jgi:hypothetical protein
MKEFTQTDLDPGNCWQTAVACVLEVEPRALPSQTAVEAQGKAYQNALNAYLEHHHGMLYTELEDYQTLGVTLPDPGWHLLVGPTVRTTPERRIHHCVVGHHGAPAWDPHPSRAGLTEVRRWGILCPLHDRLRRWRKEMLEKSPGDWDFLCVCPTCAR